MDRRWLKYKHDPEIGPLLASYHLTSDELDALKRDLRDADNIEDIMTVSRRQVNLKYRISRLVGEEEEKVFQRRVSLLWLVVVLLGVLAGAANLAVSLFPG